MKNSIKNFHSNLSLFFQKEKLLQEKYDKRDSLCSKLFFPTFILSFIGTISIPLIHKIAPPTTILFTIFAFLNIITAFLCCVDAHIVKHKRANEKIALSKELFPLLGQEEIKELHTLAVDEASYQIFKQIVENIIEQKNPVGTFEYIKSLTHYMHNTNHQNLEQFLQENLLTLKNPISKYL